MQNNWAPPWLLRHVKAALSVDCLLFGQPNQIEAHLQHSDSTQPRDLSIVNRESREELDRFNLAKFTFDVEGLGSVT